MGDDYVLRQWLRGFYSGVKIDSVPGIARREFGIGEFGQKISARHLSFRSPEEMNSFLREKTPFYISYSCASYELPAARPMERKNLLGADLVYEFDADEIKTECKVLHDSWKCGSCGASGKGTIRECPECGCGTSVDEWVCPECLAETKRQTLRLVSMLERDFGFSDGISVNFSGSKGFHIHVRSAAVQKLSKSARLELLDYVTGTNLDYKALGFEFRKGTCSCPKKEYAIGWAKKLLEGACTVFESGDVGRLSALGSVSFSQGQKLLKEKRAIMTGMGRGLLLSVSGISAEKFWVSLLSSVADSQRLVVDRQTSIDIHKIVRVPNTVHGSTGLQAKEVPIDSLRGFDALKDATVLPSDEVAVENTAAPAFHVGGVRFGPFKGESVSLPMFAAFYLLARGNASLSAGGVQSQADRRPPPSHSVALQGPVPQGTGSLPTSESSSKKDESNKSFARFVTGERIEKAV